MPDSSTHGPRLGQPLEAEVLSGLIEHRLDELRTFVRRNAGEFLLNRESVADITQSACREVIQQRQAVEWRGTQAFLGYLCKTAERKIIDKQRYYQRQKRASSVEVPLGPTPSSDEFDVRSEHYSPSALAAQGEELSQLQRALGRLPEEQRRLISMRKIFGLTTKQIGAELHLGPKAVRHRLAAAMARLSGLMGVRAPGDDAQVDAE